MMSANLKSMHEYWKQFDLPQLQKDLDGTATELASRQDDSEISRKKLVELSREFKKNTPDDARKLVAPLLKSFQAEVDALSKRSKNAEAAFLSIYKRMSDIPDPVSVLEHAIQLQKKAHKVQDLEVENRQLRDRLDEYNSEFAEVKNQEVTIKQLKEKLKEFEEKLESTAQAKAKEKEKELQRQFAEKERHLQETQLVVAKKLGEAEHQVVMLQSALNASQSESLDLKTKYDEALAAKSDEMEMLMADVERASERAMSGEREVEHLRQQLMSGGSNGNARQTETVQQSTPDMEHAIDILKRSSLEVELAAKEKEVTQLVEDVQRMQLMVNKLRDSSSSQVARLEEELTAKTRSFHILEEKLQTQSDYDEIKRELSVLKSLEFAETVGDGASQSSQSTSDGNKAKSLETLLLEKNRTLQTENTQVKVANSELNARFARLQEQYNEAFGTITEQKQLIGQLEDDLRSVNALSAMFRGDAEGEAVTSTNQSAEFVASLIKDSSQSAVLTAIDPMTLKTAADGLLPIIQSQRERFRIRAQELETVTLAQQQQVQILQNEMDKLRSDNVKLYEKIKFLQGYSTKGATVGDDAVNRYSSEYDERLDPFTTFSKRERMKKYMELRPYDKIALGMGRFIIGNKVARMIVFFYTILLHVLVFLVLYKLAYTSSCQRDNVAEDWHNKFAEHMAKVHGGHGD